MSLGCTVAYGLWAAALVLISLGWCLNEHALGHFGMAASAGAGTATVRQYFVRQNRLMRSAFDLGRESVSQIRRP